jgi:arginine/lysine/ornithine decarboxylase
MHTEAKERTPVQKAIDSLKNSRGVYKRAQELLAASGKVVTLRHLYVVAQGRSQSPTIVAAILDAVEEAKNQTATLNARAEALAQA